MKKYMTRLLSAVLTVALLCALLVLPTFAADKTGSCGDGVTFSYNETSKKLSISGSGAMANYASSSEVPWAEYRTAIEKIEIGENVTAVGDYAFYYCTAAEDITFEGNLVTSIGSYAFWMCSALEEITIPASVSAIGDHAFAYCTTLSSMSVTNLASLGSGAFAGCTALEEIFIEGALSAIREKTFMNCISLKTIAYPDTVTDANIAPDAFDGANTKREQAIIKSEAVLTIKYVDDAGEALAADYTATLAKGAAYDVASPAVDGYTVKAGFEKVAGVMPGADVEVVVMYTPVEAETETAPEETSAETGEEEPEKEPTSVIFLVLLVVILAAIGVGAFLLARADKKVTKDSRTVRKSNTDKNGKKK